MCNVYALNVLPLHMWSKHLKCMYCRVKVLITHNSIHAIFPGALEDFEGAVAMQE